MREAALFNSEPLGHTKEDRKQFFELKFSKVLRLQTFRAIMWLCGGDLCSSSQCCLPHNTEAAAPLLGPWLSAE